LTIQELLLGGGGVAVCLLTLVQIAPVKINPWSWLAKALGRALNADVLAEVKETRKRLDAHIEADDEREADRHRERILRFNNELVRGLPHTKEDFVDILATIDAYERYCETHPDYKNSRAVHAIANIGKNYDERLEKRDFL
jgi:hypothetical protein